LIICSTVKRFLGISAPFKMDPDANSLTQKMDPVKGGRSLTVPCVLLICLLPVVPSPSLL
jgi:hypothetical protein